jgi:glycosyltransferase involved in cell wall biosynthesis
LRKLAFPVLTFIYRRCDGFVVYGKHVKKHLEEIGVQSKKIFIGWQTVDNELFNRHVSDETVRDIRESLEVGNNHHLLLSIGRLVEEKGHKYLIEAVGKLNDSSVVIVLVGNGPCREYLEEVAREKNVNLRIIEYVPNDELINYIAASDVFVLPSITTRTFKEPWGLVINEVMNQGKPIITTDAVGAAVGGLLKDGRHGFVVPERDESALAFKLRELIESPFLRQKLGDAARLEVSRWTYERMAEGFISAVRYVWRI